MFKWIGDYGFKADIPALRREHPTMLTFAAWLKAQAATKRDVEREAA